MKNISFQRRKRLQNEKMSLRPAGSRRRRGGGEPPPKNGISFRFSDSAVKHISAGGLVTVPMPYTPFLPEQNCGLRKATNFNPPRTAPPTELEELQCELRELQQDNEPPPLEDEAAAEGGATCRVLFTGTTVVKTCPTSSKLEFELTKHAESVLGNDRVANMSMNADGTKLTIERLTNGVAFQKAGGDRPFWTGEDSPKVGKLRNFTTEAKARLRADVERLHANGIAHGDIHAGNIAIRSLNDDGQVTDAIFIDWSEAVDLLRLGDVPTNLRKLGRGWNTGAEWRTPYVEKLMRAGLDTAEGLFETAKMYDRRRLDSMGV